MANRTLDSLQARIPDWALGRFPFDKPAPLLGFHEKLRAMLPPEGKEQHPKAGFAARPRKPKA